MNNESTTRKSKEISMLAATMKLEDKLLSMPCEDQIYLVEKLLKSLNAPSRVEMAQKELNKAVDYYDNNPNTGGYAYTFYNLNRFNPC